MYTYNRRKELIFNIVYITVILLMAVFSTYHIYNKFQEDRSIDMNSESLDVTYHEMTGNKMTIKKVTPVTDSVGLSSKSYTISIKNNLTEKVPFELYILDDKDTVEEDECEEISIPKEDIRVSVKIDKKDNVIYTLDEIEDGLLLEDSVKALDTVHISVRLWVSQESSIPMGSVMHYHGLLQVEEKQSEDAYWK